MSASSSPKPDPLKRVLSHGSNGSAAISTPTNGHAPLSPSSGGVRTPKASGNRLPPTDNPDGRKDGEKLATDLHQLKVQSPTMTNQTLPSITQQALNIPAQSSDVGRGLNLPAHRQASTNSSSTEGSSDHPYPPSSLGTSYGPEGFPRTTTPGEETTVDPYMSVQAMAAVAAADEAIKQINGTATVRHAPSVMGVSSENPFQLPRGYANFVNPQYRDKPPSPPDYSASRQSSTSSTTTEASTSSEESDLCIPSIEWVHTKNNFAPPPHSNHSPYQFTPYMPNAVPQVRPRSPIPPPRPAHPSFGNGKSAATNSPRRSSGTNGNGNGETKPEAKPTIPLGVTAHSPGGKSSAMPAGLPLDEPAEDDDDEQTVGHNRSRSQSRSTSSESGLGALSHVASGEQQTTGSLSDAKGKRKAGTQAVAQWRESGIPTGVDKKPGPRRSSGTGAKTIASSSHQATPPRKRRRSEMSDTNIDPLLRGDRGDSAMEVEDALASEGSDDEEEVNSGDSEYGASSRTKPRASRGRGGRKAGAPRGRTSGVGTTKAAPKKTKKASGSPAGSNRRASAGTAAATAAGGVQCEYINPLPVSITHSDQLSLRKLCTDLHSRTTDAQTFLLENTTCRDTWPDMLDERASWCLRVNCPKSARLCGKQSRTSQKSLATSAARASRGKLHLSYFMCAIEQELTSIGWTH